MTAIYFWSIEITIQIHGLCIPFEYYNNNNDVYFINDTLYAFNAFTREAVGSH